MYRKNIILVAVALILNICSCFSQDTQGMFMHQVDGNKYERLSCDKIGFNIVYKADNNAKISALVKNENVIYSRTI